MTALTNHEPVLSTSLHFALGAASDLVYSTLANAAINARYRVLMMADTLIGVAIAWAFSHVLPSWERTQIPALRTRCAA